MDGEQRPVVLVVGDTFVDVVAGPLSSLPDWGTDTESPGPIEALPGGSAQNTASGLAKFGINTTLFTALGNDVFGNTMRTIIKQRDVTLIDAGQSQTKYPTGVCIVLSGPSDRGFCSHYGVSNEFGCDGMSEEMLSQFTHVHIGGYFSCKTMRETLPSFLERARNVGCSISLDTNFDCTGEWSKRDNGLLLKILPLVDVMLPNETEAIAISGEKTVEAAAKWLAKIVRNCVVVTQGPDGVLVMGRNTDEGKDPIQLVSMKSPKVAPHDPVGAGDAFDAGFIARFASHASIADATAFGMLSGSYQVLQRGASECLPTAEMLADFSKECRFDTDVDWESIRKSFKTMQTEGDVRD